jgi:hypothetical protein
MENRTFDPNGDMALIMKERGPPSVDSPSSVKSLFSVESIFRPRALSRASSLSRTGSLPRADSLPETRSLSRARSSSIVKSETEDGSDQDISDGGFRMLVSSKHLILASPVFKVMLQDCFKEGQTLRSGGFLDLLLPDDDPAAFCILLDIIHGRNRKVPREIDMGLLAGITILVDKYQLQEVVEI